MTCLQLTWFTPCYCLPKKTTTLFPSIILSRIGPFLTWLYLERNWKDCFEKWFLRSNYFFLYIPICTWCQYTCDSNTPFFHWLILLWRRFGGCSGWLVVFRVFFIPNLRAVFFSIPWTWAGPENEEPGLQHSWLIGGCSLNVWLAVALLVLSICILNRKLEQFSPCREKLFWKFLVCWLN